MDTREHLLAIEQEMNQKYIGRSDEVHGLILAALTGQHIELLGPPGTGKSMMIREFCSYLGASNFHWLMTPFTTPDELFGPVDIQAYQGGVYKRVVDHKLPTVEVAYLDELYKGSGSMLTTLLSVLQERIFYNNGTPVQCPLRFCVGSSNEIPAKADGLDALRDRFLLRYNCGYLQDVKEFDQLLRLNYVAPTVVPLAMETVKTAYSVVREFYLSEETLQSVSLVWERLGQEGVVVSDRRYKQLLDVMAAESWILNATEIIPDSLLVGKHVLWTEPDKRNLVWQVVVSSVNPQLVKAQAIQSAAQEAMIYINGHSTHEELIQVSTQLYQLSQDLVGMGNGQTVEGIKKEVGGYLEQVFKWFAPSLN